MCRNFQASITLIGRYRLITWSDRSDFSSIRFRSIDLPLCAEICKLLSPFAGIQKVHQFRKGTFLFRNFPQTQLKEERTSISKSRFSTKKSFFWNIWETFPEWFRKIEIFQLLHRKHQHRDLLRLYTYRFFIEWCQWMSGRVARASNF